MNHSGIEPGAHRSTSFRDPSGRLFNLNGRVFRIVNPSGVDHLKAFLASNTAARFERTGRLVSSRVLDKSQSEALLEQGSEGLAIEHEPIRFQSYPYEWPPEMLYAACELTLDLADSLLDEGLGLKDATPYNILFRGPDPVFVDVLSFEKRVPGDPIWLANAQLERTFLLPLLVNRTFGVRLAQLLTVRRDGLEPEEVYRFSRGLNRFSPGFFSLVTLPVWFGAARDRDDLSLYRPRKLADVEKARFVLRSLFKRLRRTLRRLEPSGSRQSTWSEYMDGKNNYTEESFEAKTKFVDEALVEFAPARVLDVGANTGHFSMLAARHGSNVVAIDHDEVVVGEIWRRAKAEKVNVLPLVVDVTRPTPALGWRNGECASFLDRARGEFDAVLMLALIHHMLVTERIPLAEIINLAAELTQDILIIEWISPQDLMFRRIARGRDDLFTGLNAESFEAECRRRFEIVRKLAVSQETRRLYLLRKKV
jgi:SAM-dependent methyltransferase